MMSIVKLISDKLNSSIENKGSGSLVVSGGCSPISIYEELSNIDISWSKVFLTLVDDRLVDPDHRDSNQKLLHNHFIKNKAQNINFFPLTENFLSNSEFKKPFDVTLLGMGEDGHIASLFPGTKAIENNDSLYVANEVNIKTKWRVTSTFHLLGKIEKIYVLATGESKKNILKSVNGDNDLPINVLTNYSKNIEIITDQII